MNHEPWCPWEGMGDDPFDIMDETPCLCSNLAAKAEYFACKKEFEDDNTNHGH